MEGFRAFQLRNILVLVSVCVPAPRTKINFYLAIAEWIQRTEVGNKVLNLFVTQPISQPASPTANLWVVSDFG